MLISFHNLRSSGKSSRGFTLVELLAVTAIITIITLVLLLRQSRFDSSTILRSVAYSAALSMRQAQVYGVSVLGSNNAGPVTYAHAYGIYFAQNLPNNEYIIYADNNPANNQYDSGEEVKIFTLTPGYRISDACAILADGTTKRCIGPNNTQPPAQASIDIEFRRPNPDAVINNNASYVRAYIQIVSSDGTTRSVVLTTAGQITVQAPGTPP
jgi:prepilin-type N-terminal cleavage/methylation domain-containing protein